MGRLPSQLTYNDLNGAEAIDILTDWFRQLLASQPVLQPHLTLPMAKITLDIGVAVDMYVGGTVPVSSPPERLDIAGSVTLDNSVGGGGAVRESRAVSTRTEANLGTVINAAPIPGGQPPDQIREQHDLPISRPSYGPRETGSHLFLADVVAETDRRKTEALAESGGREGVVADGYRFSSETALVGHAASVAGSVEQVIPVDRGKIEIDLTGEGKTRVGGMVQSAGTHISSKKVLGDQGGSEYGSVGATYDAGPAGLARPGSGGGLYRDGRSRISFGNSQRG